MELPPDDSGLDLGDLLPPPDDGGDAVHDAFSEDLADAEWLEPRLAEVMVDDDVAHDLLPRPGDEDGVDICHVQHSPPRPLRLQ